jgi:magnesium transporter
MVSGWPASADPSPARVWRRIRSTGEIRQGRGLLSMHRPADAELIWQHLDRADESGVRSFVSTSGFAYGEELLGAALAGPSRARIVEHGKATSFAFLAAHWVPPRRSKPGQVATEPIAIVIADDYLLTVGRAGTIDCEAVARRVSALVAESRDRPPTVSALRVFVLLGLLERVVEDFANCADELAAMLNRIEETVFAHPPDGLLGSHAIYQYKRELMTLKRAVIPLQQPLAAMLGQQSAALDGNSRQRLNGVGNNVTQVIERALYCDDAINWMLQANLAQVDVAQTRTCAG